MALFHCCTYFVPLLPNLTLLLNEMEVNKHHEVAPQKRINVKSDIRFAIWTLLLPVNVTIDIDICPKEAMRTLLTYVHVEKHQWHSFFTNPCPPIGMDIYIIFLYQ